MARGIPQKMKAAVLHDWGDLRYEDVETPSYGPHEVLCRVSGCGICATDVHIAKGELKGIYPPHLPFIMGHEWYGEVEGVRCVCSMYGGSIPFMRECPPCG